ncbi:MAG: hypothetical protein CK426_08525 [Legionella sp.]|nr:MAG: hypothetical protein CK423_07360 [Legionella sp.]PJD97109.1 MAG: hypothetical protein CK426_08525 [Legionella sp.]
MTIPKKALKESQLEGLTTDSAVDSGSHQIHRVSFTEQGKKKTAYFKRIDSTHHYPELLALMSVAASAFKRSFQGDHSAEERLVFNEQEQLVGTLSITVDQFKPFNFAEEPVPANYIAREQVIPSIRTLLEKNIIEILVGRYFLDDDDAHPHNLGFAGDHAADIDFDMFWYWFTIWMKEPRPVIGVPKTSVMLTVSDWETFPVIKDAKIYHWPTYQHPGEATLPSVVPGQGSLLPMILPKPYADPSQFQELARHSDAHRQKFAAALKILVTHQPDVMRARLYELFGDMPLNYTSLSQELIHRYEASFPSLCNLQTNTEPFVQFIMNLYQKHYDNLYRVVVFYMGCEDNGHGVRLSPTCELLHSKPSFYKDIVKWTDNENRSIEDEALQYNKELLKKKYHQIWRDAFAPKLNQLLRETFKLTTDLLSHTVSQKKRSTYVPPSLITGKDVLDENFTMSLDYFSTFSALKLDEFQSSMDVDRDSDLYDAVKLLIAFTNTFYDLVKQYYQKSYLLLTDADNTNFIEAIGQLQKEKVLKIREKLANTSSWANDFFTISSGLKVFIEHIWFQMHLASTDEQMMNTWTNIKERELRACDDPEVLGNFNDALFNWARMMAPHDLTHLLLDIVNKNYFGLRKTEVVRYLSDSGDESGDNRMAYILSSGSNSQGTLNTLLIQNLIPRVLQTRPSTSINAAMRSSEASYYLGVLVESSVRFAKEDARFVHLYNTHCIKLFYQTLFSWVRTLPKSQFDAIVKDALKQYSNQLSLLKLSIWAPNRKQEAKHVIQSTLDQAKALALIFVKGEHSSSLNGILFHSFVGALQEEIRNATVRGYGLGHKLISQYDEAKHRSIYLGQNMRIHSAEESHNLSVSTANAAAVY